MATLTINFTATSPAPAGGYEIKYRPVGTTGYTTLNVTVPPAVIFGVLPNVDYQGTIKAVCSSSLSSTLVEFTASAPVQSNELFLRVTQGSNQTTVQCMGQDVSQTQTTYRFQLEDANGDPVNATQLVTINFDTVYHMCTGSTQNNSEPIQIPVGQNYVERMWTTEGFVDCGQSSTCQPEYDEIVGITSITPSGITQI